MHTPRCLIPLALFIAAVAGIVVGLLFINGYLTHILLTLWITFGISIGIFLVGWITSLIAAQRSEPILRNALGAYGTPLLVSTLGTTIITIGALSITLALTPHIAAMIGLLAAFAAFMVLMLAFLLIRVYNQF